jgi:Heat induced stress protein YflT
MDKHAQNVVGVFDSEQEAIAAIDELLKRGYSKNEISVIGKHVDHVTGETGAAVEESAATGAIAGGALGGVTGLLAGAGALAIPGIGPLIAAGPIATSIVGAVTGAGLGGLTGALVGMGIPDDEAEYYENSIKEGKILVLVEKRPADHPNDRNYLHDHMEDRSATLVAGHPREMREQEEDEFIPEGHPQQISGDAMLGIEDELPPSNRIRPDEAGTLREGEFIPEQRSFPEAGYNSRTMGSTIDEDIDMERGSALDEVAAGRESGAALDEVESTRENTSRNKKLSLKDDPASDKDGSSLKGGSTPIDKANNSSMVRDYEEVKRLGNEMEENKTAKELRKEHLRSDPIQ